MTGQARLAVHSFRAGPPAIRTVTAAGWSSATTRPSTPPRDYLTDLAAAITAALQPGEPSTARLNPGAPDEDTEIAAADGSGLADLLRQAGDAPAVHAMAFGCLSSAIQGRRPGWQGRVTTVIAAAEQRINQLYTTQEAHR
jgi:hypothetical protein